MPSRVRTVLILLLTFGLLWFFFRNADMPRVWAEVRHARATGALARREWTTCSAGIRDVRDVRSSAVSLHTGCPPGNDGNPGDAAQLEDGSNRALPAAVGIG